MKNSGHRENIGVGVVFWATVVQALAATLGHRQRTLSPAVNSPATWDCLWNRAKSSLLEALNSWSTESVSVIKFLF